MKFNKGIAVTLVAMLFGLAAILVAMIMVPILNQTVNGLMPAMNQSDTGYEYVAAVMGFVPFFFLLSVVLAIFGAIAAGGAM
jgi:ABC-type sulfate transport system permease component